MCLEYFRTRLHTCSTCCCRCPRQFRGVRLKCRSSVAPAVAPLAPSAPLRRVYSVASQSHFAIVASVAASVVVDSSVLCLGSAFVFGFAFSHEANAARASSIARHGTAQWVRRQRSRNLKFSEYRNRNRSLLCLPLSLSLSQSQSGSVCFSDNESERPSGGNSFCAALCVCCVVVVIQANVVCCPLSPSAPSLPPLEAYTKLSKLEAVQFNLCVLLSSPSPSPSQLPSLSVFVAM